jgi:hypothetical protein
MDPEEVDQADETISLRFFNSKKRKLSFGLEPWGESYTFDADEEVQVIATGPASGVPEIVLEDEGVTIWCWPGSTAQLFKNGQELGAAAQKRTRVPVNSKLPR